MITWAGVSDHLGSNGFSMDRDRRTKREVVAHSCSNGALYCQLIFLSPLMLGGRVARSSLPAAHPLTPSRRRTGASSHRHRCELPLPTVGVKAIYHTTVTSSIVHPRPSCNKALSLPLRPTMPISSLPLAMPHPSGPGGPSPMTPFCWRRRCGSVGR